MRGDPREASDFELLRMSRSSDRAFADFYRRYERLVVGWLMRQTGQPDVVADLTAEVFAAAYIAAPGFREGPEPAGAWLLGIARNKLLRSLRRDRIEISARRRLAVERVQVSDESLAAIEELRNCGALELLEGLPEDQREAVRARVIEQVEYHELALSAAISPELARKRVSRGLAALRKRIEQEGTER
jgi:RNA polymerase sigma-70 factor (ECF subfamily)